MERILSFLFLLLAPFFCCAENKPEHAKPYKIGVCIMATGSYDACAQSLIESGRRFFCRNHEVTYFVFTDGTHISEASDVVKVQQAPLGLPYDMLKRCHVYSDHQNLFEKCDYIFAFDADITFAAPVGEEVLSDLVAIQHPAFLRKRGSYENKKISSAYVGPQEGQHYFTSRVFGGNKNEFCKLLRNVKKMIDIDLGKNFIARFYDEGYLNRYFIDHPPTRILSPSYCYPEDWQLDFPKKIIASSKK